VKVDWSQVQHEQTQQWLSQITSQYLEETPVLPEVAESGVPMLDLESIPEVVL